MNDKQNYSVIPKNRFFYSTSISRQLATGKGSHPVMRWANCFSAEICEKEVLPPIGRPDTEVVSLLPRSNSPHSPLRSEHEYQNFVISRSILGTLFVNNRRDYGYLAGGGLLHVMDSKQPTEFEHDNSGRSKVTEVCECVGANNPSLQRPPTPVGPALSTSRYSLAGQTRRQKNIRLRAVF